jgi:drug/metabolite transporter (DMT)-like permease
VDGALGVAFVGCWSSGFIGAKLGAADAPVTTVLMWRFVPLVVVLVPVALLLSRRAPRMPRAALGRQVAVGLLSQSGYLLTVYAAIGLGVNTGTTALIDGIQPLVAAALVGPLLGQVVARTQWVGLVLGAGGVAVVTTADATANGGVPWWAYGIPLSGMLCLVGATFLERRATVSVPPIQVLSVHCVTSAGFFTVLALATGTAVPPSGGSFWGAMAWLILLSTMGGYGLYWLLLRRMGITQVNALMFLMAPVTAVWGALLFGESFSAVTGAGLALGLIAVLVVRFGQRPVAQSDSDLCTNRGHKPPALTASPPSVRRFVHKSL